MNRLLLLASALCICSLAASAQLPRIVVQGTGSAQVFTDLEVAVAAAQPGDHVYLSGGNFDANGAPLIVDKTLHFVGAGMNPDSAGATGTTILNLQLRITTAASNSSFTGLKVAGDSQFGTLTDGSDDDPTNVVFQRCEFGSMFAVNTNNTNTTSSSIFDECIFKGQLSCSSNGGTTATLTRCIFSNADPGAIGNLVVRNSVMIAGGGSTPSTGLYENCVFAHDFFGAGGPSTYINCLMVASGLPVGATGSGNFFGIPLGNIFVNEINNSYEFADDLHLPGGSPGANAGNDGTDIGLYGSLTPYKPGAVPVNPHYRVANIANTTDFNGSLPVSITVVAQPN